MTTFRIAATELRRLTSGKLPRLAVIALVLVPLLYGSLYVYANWDPYGRLNNTPAALVVADQGATTADGKHLHVGQDVADQLARSNTFQWHRVDQTDAEAGVRTNKYGFALILPADLSAALASPANLQPRQGQLTLITNDANNYLLRTIADKLVDQVHASVTASVGSQAADRLLLGFGTIHDKLADAVTGAGQLTDGAGKANAGANQLATGTATLASGQHTLATGANGLADGANKAAGGAGSLAAGLDTLRERTAGLPAQTAALASGAQQVAAGNAQLAAAGNQVAGLAQQFVSGLDGLNADITAKLGQLGLSQQQIDQVLGTLGQLRAPIDQGNQRIQATVAQLNTLAGGAQQVANGAQQLASAAPQLAGGIQQAAAGADQLRTGTGQLASGANQLRDGLGTAATGADQLAAGARQLHTGTDQLASGSGQLRDNLNTGLGQVPNPDARTRAATAQTIGDPLAVQQIGQTSAPNYGSGLAPFFLSLATWIGAFVLFLLVRPLSRRALAAGAAPLRVALGGYLPAAALSVAQVIVLLAMVFGVVGVHPTHPLAAFGFLILAGLANVAIVHALNALLSSVGKFLSLVLLILQLISAGGTFPWQTIPHVLYPLHVVLPMGYVVDGLRHLVYGGSLASLATDCLVLVGYLVAGLALAVFAARKQRVWTASRLKPELVL